VDSQFDLHILQPAPNRVDFGTCPICLSSEPHTEEHVPPAAVGGRVMTSTCSPCNNELGSSIDKPFVDSMFGRLATFSLSTEQSNGVKGFRKYRNVRIAPGQGHEAAVWIDGDRNAAQTDLWSGAKSFETRMKLPSSGAVNLGELKSLYLACCVIVGEILSGATAEKAREALVAVRDDRSLVDEVGMADVPQWVRHIRPFDAEVAKPDSQPIHQAVVIRDGQLIPAVGWIGYTCESPFEDSPELTRRLTQGVAFVQSEL
jgi:hypothetical protein